MLFVAVTCNCAGQSFCCSVVNVAAYNKTLLLSYYLCMQIQQSKAKFLLKNVVHYSEYTLGNSHMPNIHLP